MSVKVRPRSDKSRHAYVLLRAIKQIQNVPNGVTSAYGAEQCNRLLDSAIQLAADDPDILSSLRSLEELQFRPGRGAWPAVEADVFLAELKGMLAAFIDLHMSGKEKQRLGLQ